MRTSVRPTPISLPDIANWRKSFTPSQLRQRLRSAIGDCLEQSNHWYPDEVAAVDRMLKAKGCLTLCEARIRFSGRLEQILRKKKLRLMPDLHYLQSLRNAGILSARQDAAAALLSQAAHGKTLNWTS
jgi:hypothetical protein